jgi:hypothetical protein
MVRQMPETDPDPQLAPVSDPMPQPEAQGLRLNDETLRSVAEQAANEEDGDSVVTMREPEPLLRDEDPAAVRRDAEAETGQQPLPPNARPGEPIACQCDA